MSNGTKTIRYTATLPAIYVEELKNLAKEQKIPSVNFAIKEAVDDYLKQVKRAEYEAQMRNAGADKEFLLRTTRCTEDFAVVDSEVAGEW